MHRTHTRLIYSIGSNIDIHNYHILVISLIINTIVLALVFIINGNI